MGFLKSIGDFLFGKDPNIFDDNGNVRHKHLRRTWDQWDKRYKQDDFNWRNHTGTRANTKKQEANNFK